MDRKKSFAPYNFVPFDANTDVPKRYKKKEDLQKFDQWGEGTKSGEITFTLTPLTPLCIGDGNTKKGTDEAPGEVNFTKDKNENPIIPGSTLRGCVRSHAELLSFSYPEFIDGNRRYLYRSFADKRGEKKDQYDARFRDLEKKEQADAQDSLHDVKAGILYKEETEDGKRYFIQPVKEIEGHTFYKIKDDFLKRYNIKGVYYLTDKDYCPYRVNTTFSLVKGNGQTTPDNFGKGNEKGFLLNSENIANKKHHYLVVREQSDEPAIPVTPEQADDYRKDYQRNCIGNTKLSKNKSFYDLPSVPGIKNGVPFFYKVDRRTNELIGFGPTPQFRIFYTHDVAYGIPFHNSEPGYDYARSLFGYADANDSYRSRVSFENGIYEGTVEYEKKEMLLSGPRGSAVQMYLEQNGRTNETLNTYNRYDFQLRGYKFYWKRGNVASVDVEEKVAKDGTVRNKMISSYECVKPGNGVFRCKARFQNLTEDELGLLLYAIKFFGDETQESYMIGAGKPYGFGKVEIGNVKLFLYDEKTYYLDAIGKGIDQSSKIPGYKKVYKDYLKDTFGIDFENMDAVRVHRSYAKMDNADKYLNSMKDKTKPYMQLVDKTKEDPDYRNQQPLEDAATILSHYCKIEVEVNRKERDIEKPEEDPYFDWSKKDRFWKDSDANGTQKNTGKGKKSDGKKQSAPKVYSTGDKKINERDDKCICFASKNKLNAEQERSLRNAAGNANIKIHYYGDSINLFTINKLVRDYGNIAFLDDGKCDAESLEKIRKECNQVYKGTYNKNKKAYTWERLK